MLELHDITKRYGERLALDGIGFTVGIGCWDYWGGYVIGRPTPAHEDHSNHGAYTWKDYFKVNTDHKVIGVQYLVTTFIFFMIGGMLAEGMRAELATPGQVIVHRVYDGFEAPAPAPVPAPAVSAVPFVHGARCDLCDSRILNDRYVSMPCLRRS